MTEPDAKKVAPAPEAAKRKKPCPTCGDGKQDASKPEERHDSGTSDGAMRYG